MRFSIRDLLLVTTVVGLCVGWWIDHRYLEAKFRKEREQNAPLREGIVLLREVMEKMEGPLKVTIAGENFSSGSENDKSAKHQDR